MPKTHNLLPQPTPFIGRQQELAEVQERLAQPACRLLTLAGPGGSGKTRLALEVAERLAPDYAGGVYFAPLQAAETVGHLVTALVDALGFSLHGQQAPRDQLLAYLEDRELLLVADNFEQLLPAPDDAVETSPETGGAGLLTHILAAAPDVTLLVTSRQVLSLQQEWVYPLGGLGVPEAAADAGAVDTSDAVRLFVERARRVRPDFELAPARRDVVRICRLVEGMPLAIELAASWLRALDPAAIAAEIQDNVAFLATRLRDVPRRHRNLQAVFDHSWQLLSREEQEAFQALSVFRGGFDRPAARAVTGATLPLLSALVDKCMLQYLPHGQHEPQLQHGERYHVHELLRQYGEEKLEASPTLARQAHQRHCDYYAAFLHRRLSDIQGGEQRRAAAEIGVALDNVRAAWGWAVSQADVEALNRAATPYFFFCQFQSHYLEGADRLRSAARSLARHAAPPDAARRRDLTLARLRNHEGWLRLRLGEFDRARQVLEESRRRYRELDTPTPPDMGGDPATPLAIVHLIQGEAERAVALCEEALQAAQRRDDLQNQAFAHYGLTAAQAALGQYEAAGQHAEQACAAARAAGNRWFLAHPLVEWGHVARAMGHYAEARRHYRASYAIKQEFDDPEGMAVALNHLGEIAILQEAYDRAHQHFSASLDIYREINDRGGLATALKGLGQVAWARQDAAAARERFAEALRIASAIQFLPLVLSIFIEVEPLLHARDTKAAPLSVALLTLVQAHPASEHRLRTRAGRRLEQYAAELSPAVLEQAVQQGQAWDVETALVRLQARLDALSGPDHGRDPGDQSLPDQPLVDPLTQRELEVLGLMAQGRTNPEIAAELVLALGTVKWYASQIYSKLGVSNRTAAAARARELELL